MPHNTSEKRKQWETSWRERRIRMHLCVKCGSPVPLPDEKISCESCRNISNEQVKQIALNHLQAGRCRCGKKCVPQKRTCQKCLDLSKNRLRTLKLKVIQGYGGRCNCCGISEWQFLSIDHVVERGTDERKRLGQKSNNSAKLYRSIIEQNFPNTYQILCFNCNMSLGFFGYCPHHPEIQRSIAKTNQVLRFAQTAERV